jgi:hypothetical protein
MKSLAVFALLVWSTGVSAYAQPRESIEGYSLGRRVGECLVVKCQIFTGWLATETPKSGEPVMVRLDKQLYGDQIHAELVPVPYANPKAVLREARSPNQAWENVVFGSNAPVAVVMAGERIRIIPQGDPVVVTSSQREVEIIRSLVAEAIRLQASPESISDSVASLSRASNPALAGFLHVHLLRVETVNTPEFGATLLGRMIGNPGVPSGTWEEIANYMVLDYTLLSPSGRAAMVQRFAAPGAAERCTRRDDRLRGVGGPCELRHLDSGVPFSLVAGETRQCVRRYDRKGKDRK